MSTAAGNKEHRPGNPDNHTALFDDGCRFLGGIRRMRDWIELERLR